MGEFEERPQMEGGGGGHSLPHVLNTCGKPWVPKFSIFKSIRTTRKYRFRLRLDDFFGLNFSNVLTFDQWSNVLDQICDSFYCNFEKWSKLSQKIVFLPDSEMF